MKKNVVKAKLFLMLIGCSIGIKSMEEPKTQNTYQPKSLLYQIVYMLIMNKNFDNIETSPKLPNDLIEYIDNTRQIINFGWDECSRKKLAEIF